MNRKTLAAFVVAACLGLSAMPAFASSWHNIYDSNQYTQNYIKAVKTLEISITEAEKLLVIKQQATPLTQDATASLEKLDAMTELEQEVELTNALISADRQMLGTVNRAIALFETLKSQWGTSDLSFDAFCGALAGSANQRDQALVKSFQASTQEMAQVAARRGQIIQALGGAIGQTQAIQAVGAAIDVLVGQQQQILNLMTVEAADAVAKDNAEKARSGYALQVMRAYEARKRAAASGVK